MNKKAEIGATITLLVATFIIVFILAIFIMFSTLISSGVSKQAAEDSLKISLKESAMISLQAYLQTNVNIENKEILMSDLIRLAIADNSYQEILQTKTKEILNPIYGENCFIHADLMEIVSGPADAGSIISMSIPAQKPITIRMGVKS